MEQKNTPKPRLRGKQFYTVDTFFSKLEKYEVKTENNDEACIRLFNNAGKITLFEEDAKKYQYYGYQIIKRLINKGIFYIKETKNPETGRKVKALCISKDNKIVQDFTQG